MSPGGGGFNPYGAPAGPPPTGAGRFFKAALIGGAIAGVLSAIPLIGALNCCFCLLVQAGAIIAVQMYLKEYPQDTLSNGDAALCGAMAGGMAGIVSGILQFILNLIMGGGAGMAAALRQLPPDVSRSVGPLLLAGGGIVLILISVIIEAGFGALGGVLGMSLFFKDRQKK